MRYTPLTVPFMQIPSITSSKAIPEASLAIRTAPEPFLGPIPTTPVPAHTPSLADASYSDASLNKLIKQCTTICSFLIPFDVNYEIDKQRHLALLTQLRAQLTQIVSSSHVTFDSILEHFEAAKITFMFHDTLLTMVPNIKNRDESSLHTYADSIEQASENSWQSLAAIYTSLIENHHSRAADFTKTFQFCALRAALLHQFLSYDNKALQQDHCLRFQDLIVNAITEGLPKHFFQKEILLPLVKLCYSEGLSQDKLKTFRIKYPITHYSWLQICSL